MGHIPVKTPNDRFTDDQWQAIYEGGNNILVSASAGSGKTTVLVQRIIEKIRSGLNVDELLVVTFTEAAAKEMKERITQAVQKTVNSAASTEQYQHLIHQVPLMAQANISTIHAFCLRVIQRYFYLIDLDPSFRLMADTVEAELLKEDVWEELKEELYGEPGTFFKMLARAYSQDRNDSGLKDIIFSLYSFSRANPDPDQWLLALDGLYEVNNGFTNTRLYQQLLKPQIESQVNSILYDIRQGLSLCEKDDSFQKQQAVFESDLAVADQLKAHLDQDELQLMVELLEQSSTLLIKWPPTRKTDDAFAEKNRLKGIRDHYKQTLGELKSNYFNRPIEEQVRVLQEVRPFVTEMARVTIRFSRALWQRKLVNNVLDFNDLEHLALQILAPISNEDNQRHISEAGRYYRRKFAEVLIDEYQDVNQLQESILYWVTRHEEGEENLFMVGDVKQSIYAFRLADPRLFIKKYQQFGDHQQGERIILAENFRSRAEVLSFTNFIFQQLMDERVGQITYDQNAALVQGNRSFPEGDRYAAELLLYITDKQDENGQEEQEEAAPEDEVLTIDDKTSGEISMVADKITQLIQTGFLIYDKESKQERPVRYRDIVLLTPTRKNNLAITELFKEYRIPMIMQDAENYFQRTEISIMLSLLKVIDNPRQDIPLAAVLRSPIVGLNERQLSLIRVANKNEDYYTAVGTFMETARSKDHLVTPEEEEAVRKLQVFLEHLDQWRELSAKNNLVTLIWDIYQKTDFLDYVGGLSSGKQRVANLHAFYERAQKYENTSYKGLFQFIRFIEKIRSHDKDLAEPASFSDDEDAVRVMTIHGSKGLEFPVVFVMDLTKRFNLSDTRSRLIFSEEYGIGTDWYDPVRRIQYPSVVKQALAFEKKKSLLAEEMRKLYVALTRAEQKLYLVGSWTSEEKMWQDWSVVDDTTEQMIPDYLRLSAPSLMKWIGMALYRHEAAKNDYFAKEYRGELSRYPVSFRVSTYHAADLLSRFTTLEEELSQAEWQEKLQQLAAGGETSKEEKSRSDMKLAIALMEYEYPYHFATITTSYQSVSEIKRLFEDPDQNRLLQLDMSEEAHVSRYVEPNLPRPAFLQKARQPTAAEVGTATHYVLQALPLDRQWKEEEIRAFIADLVAQGSLNENVAGRINVTQVSAFFQSDLGQQLLQYQNQVKREVPFSLLLKARDIFEEIENDDDHLLIHGIIDGFIEFEKEMILFDFKTDYVNKYNISTVVDKYRGQLKLYVQALESISGKKVSHAYLSLLSIRRNIDLLGS